MCNCPRQCRHLSYKRDITQAMFSNYLMKLVSQATNGSLTPDQIRADICMLQVIYVVHCYEYIVA